MRMLKLMVLLIFCGFLKPQSTQSQDFQVVGNQTGVSALTQSQLVSVFKPKNNRWDNNKAVIIVLPGTNSPINEKVAQQIYSNSFVAVQKYWLSLVFQGRFNAPYFFNTDEETLNFIRKTPGAIGFVSTSAAVPEELQIKIK